MRNCTEHKQEKEEKSVFRKQAYLCEDLKNFLVHMLNSIV